jgi:hypothetical protein
MVTVVTAVTFYCSSTKHFKLLLSLCLLRVEILFCRVTIMKRRKENKNERLDDNGQVTLRTGLEQRIDRLTAVQVAAVPIVTGGTTVLRVIILVVNVNIVIVMVETDRIITIMRADLIKVAMTVVTLKIKNSDLEVQDDMAEEIDHTELICIDLRSN